MTQYINMRRWSLLTCAVLPWVSSALPAEETASDQAAMEAMGYAMASQLRLNIGFSDEELTSMFQGMRIAATGGEQPEGFEEAIQQAQSIYMARMQAFREVEEARLQQVAEKNKQQAADFFASLEENDAVQKTESGLYYEILEPGDPENKPGPTDSVVVNYRGTLIDDRQFDAGEGAEFGVNRVVPGFGEGLQLIGAGGKIRLYIPSDLAYGDGAQRPGSIIEPGSALIFEVDLLEVKAAPAPTPPRKAPTAPPNVKPGARPPGPPPNFTPPPPPNIKPPPPPTSRPQLPE